MFAFGLPSLNLVEHDTVINYLWHTRGWCFSFLSLSVSCFSFFSWSSFCQLCLVASFSVRFLFWSRSFLSPADESFFPPFGFDWQPIVSEFKRNKFCVAIASAKVIPWYHDKQRRKIYWIFIQNQRTQKDMSPSN